MQRCSPSTEVFITTQESSVKLQFVVMGSPSRMCAFCFLHQQKESLAQEIPESAGAQGIGKLHQSRVLVTSGNQLSGLREITREIRGRGPKEEPSEPDREAKRAEFTHCWSNKQAWSCDCQCQSRITMEKLLCTGLWGVTLITLTGKTCLPWLTSISRAGKCAECQRACVQASLCFLIMNAV